MLKLHEERHHPLRKLTHNDYKSPSTRMIVAGIVVVGLGIVAWSYLGADLKRYMKIHSM
jgi:hypothetical protein